MGNEGAFSAGRANGKCCGALPVTESGSKQKTKTSPSNTVPVSPPLGARTVTGLSSTGYEKERKQEVESPPPDPTFMLNEKTDRRDGDDTGVCPTGKILQCRGEFTSTRSA